MNGLAAAKINLHLHITGRASNGYHHLDSLVAFTSLCDEIAISSADDYRLTVSGSDFSEECTTDDNLITRAARLLAEHSGRPLHAHIHLVKNIPVAAGLGGGSADAATTLRMLKTFWNLTTSDDDLVAIASTLGSDIVACLHNKPVIMRETGNLLKSAPQLPVMHGLLVNPQVACPTPQVYKNHATSSKAFSEKVHFPLSFASAAELCRFLNEQTSNDLTEAAIATAPVIYDVLDELNKSEDALLCRLSGSGATCFALFETSLNAAKAYEAIKKARPEWRAFQIILNQKN